MLTLLRDRRANVAMVFGLSILPLMGALGTAVEYGHAIAVKSALQTQADAVALFVTSTHDKSGYTNLLANAEAEALAKLSGDGVQSVDFNGKWINAVEFEVTALATLKPVMLATVFGTLPVKAAAVGHYTAPSYVYKDPEIASLDPEAGDYNRIGAYCFNPTRKSATETGRTAPVWIADNGGTVYGNTLPFCDVGYTMSYVLKNVRGARVHPNRWDDPNQQIYHYYSDTVISAGLETYDFGGKAILETVLCPSLVSCKPKKAGGIITEGSNRTATYTTERCEPGKYMYYGWEDRPPGSGWTDQDYNDIRVIVECPQILVSGSRNIRLSS